MLKKEVSLYPSHYTTRTVVVKGSNESLYYVDEEIDPHIRKISPLQIIFQNFDVTATILFDYIIPLKPKFFKVA